MSVGINRSSGTGPSASSLRSVCPAHELGGDEELAVDFLEREDRRDRFVGECGRGASLARQPIAAPAIARELGRQGLERNHPAKPLVARGVDNPHAAAADLLEDSVGSDLLADERRPVFHDQVRRDGPHRRVEEVHVGPMTREQRLHFARKFRIGRGSPLEQGFALRPLDLEGRVEEHIDLLPALGVHVCD